MNLTTIRVRTFYFLVALVFVLGATFPSLALAQGGTGAGSTDTSGLVGGLNDPNAPPFIPNTFWDGLVNAFSGGNQNPNTQTGGGGSNSGGTGITLTGIWNWLTGNSGSSSGSGQTQGGAGSSGGSNFSLTGLINLFLGGNNNSGPSNTGTPTGYGGGLSIDSFFNGAVNLVLDNPITDLIVTGAVIVGNELGWSNEGGNPLTHALDNALNFAIDSAIGVSSDLWDTTSYNGTVIRGGQTIQFANGYSLTLTQGEAATINSSGSITISLTNGHTAVITSEGYVTEYNAQGEPIKSNDPAVNPGNWDGSGSKGGSSGPSIPGASKGTVGNPFSDGTDKDDAPSSNEEDTSNPYLFEYDPNSTNNNPAGSGAQTQ